MSTSVDSAKATEGRGGVFKAVRKVTGEGGGTGGMGESGGGGGGSAPLGGEVEPALAPREESGGRKEEEEPSVALGFNCAGGVAEPSASEEATCVRGVVGLGVAEGGWKGLGVEGGTLRKELLMGEGAGGGVL